MGEKVKESGKSGEWTKKRGESLFAIRLKKKSGTPLISGSFFDVHHDQRRVAGRIIAENQRVAFFNPKECAELFGQIDGGVRAGLLFADSVRENT